MIESPVKETPDELWYSKCSLHFEPLAKYKLIYTYVDTPLHTHMDFYELNLITKGSFVNQHDGEVKYYPSKLTSLLGTWADTRHLPERTS